MDFAAVFGSDRQAAVCRELTKMYEEVVRGTLEELAQWAKSGTKGEIVLVVAGAPARSVTLDEGIAQVTTLVSEGTRLKDACSEVSESTGLSKRDLYQAVISTT
jgi:16S rRNA (cytidine1402-2'-O)-methyltransferase